MLAQKMSKCNIPCKYRAYFDGSQQENRTGASWVIYMNEMVPEPAPLSNGAPYIDTTRYHKRVRFDLPFIDNPDSWTEVAYASIKLPNTYTAMDAETYGLLSLSRACAALAEGTLEAWLWSGSWKHQP